MTDVWIAFAALTAVFLLLVWKPHIFTGLHETLPPRRKRGRWETFRRKLRVALLRDGRPVEDRAW